MSQNDQTSNNEEKTAKTPLELVKEQQAMKQENREAEQNVDADPDVPGQSSPSNIRKHPQRKLG